MERSDLVTDGWLALSDEAKSGARILLLWKPLGGLSEHVELGRWAGRKGWVNTYAKSFGTEPDRWAPLAPFAPSTPTAIEGGGEPVAWLHRLLDDEGYQYDRDVNEFPTHPFGRAGKEYDDDYTVESVPLYSGLAEAAIELAARAVDTAWRSKGGLNCTEVCAIIRSAALKGAAQ